MLFLETLLANPTHFFTTVTIVIASVMLHELAHGAVAIAQGDDTPRISGHMTLNPIKLIGWQSVFFLCLVGVAWGQMPVNPTKFRWGKLSSVLVLLAGPLANLVIGFTLIELYKLSGLAISHLAQPQLLLLAAQINLILFLLNLTPIPPLDGFQIISEIIPGLRSWQRNPIGLFLLILLLLIPAFGSSLTTVAQSIINGAIA